MADIDTLPSRPAKAGKLPGVSPYVLLLREELRAGSMEQVATLTLGELDVEIAGGRDALWAIVRRKGRGGLALRAAHAPGGCGTVRMRKPQEGETARLEFDSAIGRQ